VGIKPVISCTLADDTLNIYAYLVSKTTAYDTLPWNTTASSSKFMSAS